MSPKTVKVDLPAEIFDVDANIALIHQVVVAQQAAARQGTHATKTRGEVRGGGRKPYKQKGTGRARQGSTRAPQFAGGGIVHGPQPRSYDQRTPKKMKAAALRGALSDRARDGRVHVVESLGLDKPSTKAAVKEGEFKGDERKRRVVDQPGLDAAGARHLLDLEGRGKPETKDPDDQSENNLPHHFASGSRMAVTEALRSSVLRAASAMSSTVTVAMSFSQFNTSPIDWPVTSAVPNMRARLACESRT